MSETKRGGKMALDSWEDRRKLLVRFQSELIQAFPDESDYNVYIFGSFIRRDFKPGISDIDLIIYCNDFLKRCDIYDFCSLFFKQEHLPCDILEYSYMPEGYIFVTGILNAFPMTAYYPKSLRDELYIIAKNYQQYLERQEIKKKYMRWDYLINKAKLEKGEEQTHGRYSK